MTDEQPVALVERPAAEARGLAVVIERLAANPGVDVAKLEKIIELQERILHHEAETAFNAAFTAMQAELPVIVASKQADKWKYAPLEDIVEQVRPILQRYGFSLAYRTEWPDGTTLVRVIGLLTHRDGHSRESQFTAAADQSGSKNAVQALGSTVQYGRRYTTTDLLGLVTREDDDAQRATKPTPPDGFEEWRADLEALADEGDRLKLAQAFKDSAQAFKDYVAKHYPRWTDELRQRRVAAAAKAGAR